MVKKKKKPSISLIGLHVVNFVRASRKNKMRMMMTPTMLMIRRRPSKMTREEVFLVECLSSRKSKIRMRGEGKEEEEDVS